MAENIFSKQLSPLRLLVTVIAAFHNILGCVLHKTLQVGPELICQVQVYFNTTAVYMILFWFSLYCICCKLTSYYKVFIQLLELKLTSTMNKVD
jgi:hypothetical protein